MTLRPRTEATLAANLRWLMNKAGWTEKEIEQRSGVSQKTINNVLHARYRTKVETVEQLAAAFNLDGWQMILPNLVHDIESGTSIAKLLNAYLQSSAEGQSVVLKIAEREAKYVAK